MDGIVSIYGNHTLNRRVSNLIATWRDLFAPPATQEQRALADDLQRDLAALQTGTGQQLPFWQSTWQAILQESRNGDPLYFMRWPPIAATMVNGTTAFSARALLRLRRSADWKTVWKPAITHKLYGYGPPFLPYGKTNANTVMHAAHLLHFAATTGQSWLEHDVILECGGGYGSMCRLVRALGFRGRYVIFDLPPVLALQKYYLGLHGVQAGFDSRAANLLCATLDSAAAAFGGRIAMMSTWAMSEMPPPLREQIAALLDDPRLQAALFTYQNRFEGLDNAAWFAAMAQARQPAWRWARTEIDASSDYLVGVRV